MELKGKKAMQSYADQSEQTALYGTVHRQFLCTSICADHAVRPEPSRTPKKFRVLNYSLSYFRQSFNLTIFEITLLILTK